MFEVKVNNQTIFSLAQWEMDVICNDINVADLETDLKRRLEWVLRHKAEQCYAHLEKEWMEKLRTDPAVQSIPKSKEAFVALVRARSDYKDRAAKDLEAKAVAEAARAAI